MFEVFEDGSVVYICEVESVNPPIFMWEGTLQFAPSMRVPLPNDDPTAPFDITIDINTATFSTSTLSFHPDTAGFSDPACIVGDGLSALLRVESTQFVPMPPPGKCYTECFRYKCTCTELHICNVTTLTSTGSSDIVLVSATFEVMSDGSIAYTCEVISSNPPVFMWEAINGDSRRVPLPNNNPSAPFIITDDIDIASSSSSRLLFHPDFVQLSDPECVVGDGLSSPLRVVSSQFTEAGK